MKILGLFCQSDACKSREGNSPMEVAFKHVPALQESLNLDVVQTLSPVSRTLWAVANDEYIWRNFLAREIGVCPGILKYPIDQEAKLKAEENLPEYSLHKPYSDILRGLRMYDGEMKPRVLYADGDSTQRRCIARALNFLDVHFPKRLDAIEERHRLYAQASSAIRVRAPMLGVAAGITVIPVVGGTIYATTAARTAFLPKAVAAKSLFLTQLAGLIGFKATKVLLFSACGYLAFSNYMLAIGLGRITYNEYLALRSLWRVMETKAAATKITGHLAAMRVEQQVMQRRRALPNAGINDVR